VLRNFYDVTVNQFGDRALRELGFTADSGIFFMFFTLFAVIWCDAGAYFGGRAWGRHKLARRISPGKSIEGAITGVVVGTAGAVLCKQGFDLFWPDLSRALSLEAAAIFGAILAVAGIVGDLIESLLKRDAEVKDTGALLPGTGGVLDRIDSPLLGFPVMYYGLLAYVFLHLADR
jgi:phosphatidate cytidylyltransferase